MYSQGNMESFKAMWTRKQQEIDDGSHRKHTEGCVMGNKPGMATDLVSFAGQNGLETGHRAGHRERVFEAIKAYHTGQAGGRRGHRGAGRAVVRSDPPAGPWKPLKPPKPSTS